MLTLVALTAVLSDLTTEPKLVVGLRISCRGGKVCFPCSVTLLKLVRVVLADTLDNLFSVAEPAVLESEAELVIIWAC